MKKLESAKPRRRQKKWVKLTDRGLQRLAKASKKPNKRRSGSRMDVFDYLQRVYVIVVCFKLIGEGALLADRAAWRQAKALREGQSLFAAVIRATSDTSRQTRSKWSRAMEKAFAAKTMDFRRAVSVAGGLNKYLAKAKPRHAVNTATVRSLPGIVRRRVVTPTQSG